MWKKPTARREERGKKRDKKPKRKNRTALKLLLNETDKEEKRKDESTIDNFTSRMSKGRCDGAIFLSIHPTINHSSPTVVVLF